MGSSAADLGGGLHDYSPTRRTAVVLVGEGTSVAYLAGAVKALVETGVRVDMMVGKGVGSLVAAFGAVQAGEKLWGRKGVLEVLSRQRPWRWRGPYKAGLLCLAVAFGVFVSPALFGLLLLVAFPLLAAARIVAPATVGHFSEVAQEELAAFATRLDPIYLRALAFPLALLFAWIMLRWAVPAAIRRRGARRGLGHFLGEGVIDLAPLERVLEKALWEAVRGASVEVRPPHRRDIGTRYRELLSSSLGQFGYCELVFYALDLNSGQEVPFVLLKDKWLARLRRRGPGQGAVAAEPVDLAGEAGPLFFGALVSAVSPPALAPSVLLRLPLDGRYGGEVHSFCSSLLAGQSAVADAVAAGAQQVIYISGASASGDSRAGPLERLTDAAVRQALENDLRWADGLSARPAVFVVRPDKSRMRTYEFSGRSIYGEERLEMVALAAHGARDVTRMFIQPLVGDSGRLREEAKRAGDGESPPGEETSWVKGPREL